jgi:enoyl-CoA hydratase/carnithine racemase
MKVFGERVRVSVEGGVADVRLIRAEKMNALDEAMFEALVAAGEALGQMREARAVVLSGEGRGFCAGIDLSSLASLSEAGQRGRLIARSHGDANVFQRAVLVWRDLPIPVIAAVHGVALGGGFQLMLGADIRLVEPQTKLSAMEVRWGLAPDMAGTFLMRMLARDDIIRELSFTGRTFSGEEALDFGFATRLSTDPLGEALALGREIAAKSPDAVRAVKALLVSAVMNSRAEQLLAESDLQSRLIESSNHAEAVAAGLASREPEFED